MKKKIEFILVGIFIVLVLVFVFLYIQNNKTKIDNGTEIPNPASSFCVQEGGSLDIRSSDSGEFGVCVFEDNSECEEWMFYRGECSKGEYFIDSERMCTMEYNPVCAVNGVTYSNPCMAGDVPILKEGAC